MQCHLPPCRSSLCCSAQCVTLAALLLASTCLLAIMRSASALDASVSRPSPCSPLAAAVMIPTSLHSAPAVLVNSASCSLMCSGTLCSSTAAYAPASGRSFIALSVCVTAVPSDFMRFPTSDSLVWAGIHTTESLVVSSKIECNRLLTRA